MASSRSTKDKEMAAYLKKRGITRTTGACPWGCGRSIPNGGGPLLVHLNLCQGRPKARTATKR